MGRRHSHEGGLGQRALAGAPHTPQQGVVGRKVPGEPVQILDETGLLAIDPDQQVQRQRIVRRGHKGVAGGFVPEQPGLREVGLRSRRRRQPLESVGDPRQHGLCLLVHTPPIPAAPRIAKRWVTP